MQFIWDNLAAVVITSTVVLLLLASRERMLEAQIEQTANSYIRSQSTAFASWMEENLLQMGDRLPDENPLVELTNKDYTVITEGGGTRTVNLTRRFVFQQKVQDPADTTQTIKMRTMYRLDSLQTRTIEGDSIPIFKLVRWDSLAKPSATYQRVAESPTLISYFKVEMLDQCGRTIPTSKTCNGAPTINSPPENCVEDPTPPGSQCDSDDIYDMRVRFAMVTPFDTDRETLREVYYGSTLLLPFGGSSNSTTNN
ncbi:MAG: hypothetical protein GVY18_09785 [Bacteroidetes bacterium]|jgi:hypothetical protein|nr:hypothetical protein [Bacteroidota bacterium]